MFNYSYTQWILFFYIYCVFGWCIESTYVSVKTKKLTNRGFMRGPWLPIYGSGAIVMLFCAIPFVNNIFLTFLSGMIGASILELGTGIAMEALFKVRYWDYSNRKFNIMGHVCLGNSIAWGVLTVLLINFVHYPVSKFVTSIPSGVTEIITAIWTIIISIDFALAFKAAMDFRDLLIQVEKARQEMAHMQKRMDVLIAVTADEINSRKDVALHKLDTIMDALENSFDKAKDKIHFEATENVSQAVKDEIDELRMKYATIKGKLSGLRNIKDFVLRSQIKGNPTMKSFMFEEAFESVKDLLKDKNK